jgi:hypothetical protein
VLGATAVARRRHAAPAAGHAAGAASAAQVLAFAHDEAAGRHQPLWVETRARRAGDGWVLQGAKHNVLHGAAATSWW